MAKWISLQKTDTGFVFATTHSIVGSQWDWISGVIAEEFECSPDDLETLDDDQGDFISLRGEKIVQVHDCLLRNPSRPLVQIGRAA